MYQLIDLCQSSRGRTNLSYVLGVDVSRATVHTPGSGDPQQKSTRLLSSD